MPSRGPLGKSLPGILVIFLFLTLFLCLPVLSGPQKSFSVEKRQAIENAVAGFMARNNIPGLSAPVVLNGGSYWSQGFGTADVENYSPAASSTLFRLGSLSKPIAATAVLELCKRGELDLDARAKILFFVPAEGLAHHDAGIARAPSVVSATTTRTEKARSPRTAPGTSPASTSRLRSLPVIRW